MLRIFKNKKIELKTIADEFQNLINNLEDKSNLESEGLLNGGEVIHEYVDNNECGLAFEHLLYMISESELSISDKLVERLKKLGNKLGYSNDSIESELCGLSTINLQGRTETKEGVISYYWFENKNIGLTKTLFHNLEIPLKPFDSGLTYVEQPEETSIVIEWLKLDLDNPDNLDDLNINSTEYPDLECSIYIGSAHNICTVRMLRIVRVEKDRFKIEGELFVNFENEGVGRNEDFKFKTFVKLKKEHNNMHMQ